MTDGAASPAPRARRLAPEEVTGEVPRARPVIGPAPGAGPVVETRGYLLTLGFLALGPAVIPRIRKSEAFSPEQKRFWSLMLTAYSMLMVCLLIGGVALVFKLTLGQAW